MTRRERPDADLVAAARGGDRRAFAALVERHYGVLLSTCRRATGDAELADGSEVDARPSDALTLALVTGAPIAVDAAVLDAAARLAQERPQLAAEVTAPADSASVLAAEVRARLADMAHERAELNEPPAAP